MIKHHQLQDMEVTSYHTAKKGNWCSGDAYYIAGDEDFVICAIADGLGSGEEAMEASSAVIKCIEEHREESVEDLMARCNNVLWHTRGAVLTIIKLDLSTREIVYSNVGNIGCIFYPPSGKLVRPIPSRGYMSGRKHKFKSQRIPYEEGTTFILYSDGLHFDPLFHAYMTAMPSTEKAMQQVIDRISDQSDDTTILIGKVAPES
ncbi:PP2C family serine/threonine-protein phosphatase [Alteribacter natronophilus]|uniref:PP2C family serine/threonine-protein phosphatase n=1 Tax=Alteribacter natronophilus TaxID=2583810 RepID=UPI00110D797E|nr:PP2C family serine/threonine-protein phosphatase [Alteribacter natronophilus]TMW70185.1 phosphoserine phosphatase [Alteribacter natronophilus]